MIMQLNTVTLNPALDLTEWKRGALVK